MSKWVALASGDPFMRQLIRHAAVDQPRPWRLEVPEIWTPVRPRPVRGVGIQALAQPQTPKSRRRILEILPKPLHILYQAGDIKVSSPLP